MRHPLRHVIASIPKRSSSDMYPTALPFYYQKHQDTISTELHATDNLSLAKPHKTTKTSMKLKIRIHIDTNLSFLQTQLYCS